MLAPEFNINLRFVPTCCEISPIFPRYNVVLISRVAVSKRGTCCPTYPREVKLGAFTVPQYDLTI